MPAEGDAAGLRIIESGNQAANSGFARAGRSHDRGGGLLGDAEADMLEDRPRIVAEADVLEFDVAAVGLNCFAVRIDAMVRPQGVQLIHGVVDHAEGVRAVADGLKACKNAEREEHEHQHHGEVHAAAQALQRRRCGKPHRSAFEGEQMPGVGGQIPPFDLEMDPPAVAGGSGDRFHGCARLAEGFDHGKPARIFQNGAGQIAVGLRLRGCMDAAVVRDDQHEAEGEQRSCQCDQRRERAAYREPDEDHEKVQVPADKVVDHADAHALQRGEPGGDGVQNAAGADLPEIAERNALQGIADRKTVARGELIADRLLQPCTEIVEQKAEEHEHKLDQDGSSDPRSIKRRVAPLRLDQSADGVGGKPHGQRGKDVREEGHDKAEIQLPLACAAPVNDAFYGSEHRLSLLLCG